MMSVKSFINREFIERPWFLLGIAGVAVGYFMFTSVIDWLGYFQKTMT